MIDYATIKDLIIYNDPIVGNMTLDDILNDLLIRIKNQKKFEEIVYSNLKHTNLRNKDIATIFNLSSTNIIEMYLRLIKDEL